MTLRAISRGLRLHLPGLYWRARNGYELARWSGVQIFGPRGETAYAEAFWDGHDTGDWMGFASLIVEFFKPRSVVDVGCGDGKLLAALRTVAPTLAASGYDGSATAVTRARQRGVETEQANLAFAGKRSYRWLADRIAGTDVAVCLETAEHLPPWSAGGLVHVLTRAPVVIFSAAQPLQGGTQHMNERPSQYWAKQFGVAGFDPHPATEAFRLAVGRLDLPWWYASNVQVFRRRA